jgi:hypothetical protein
MIPSRTFSLKRFWEANFLVLEFVASIFLTLAFVTWSEVFDRGAFVTETFSDIREPLYGALTALFGALLGFCITAVSIVLGYATHEKLEIVRNSKHYADLWGAFKSAIRALAFATMFALVGLVFDKDTNPANMLLYTNLFLATLSFFRIARCIWVLENIIAIVTKKRS